MDFQENRRPDEQETGSAQQPSSPADNNNTPQAENNGASPQQNGQPCQNRPPCGNGTPYPAPQQPYQNPNGAGQPPNGNFRNDSRPNPQEPYRNNMPYGGRYPNKNQNPYQNGYRPGNYGQQNGSQNNYPYYNRSTYQLPVPIPGSNLAKAAMICGALSIFFGFVFPIYPTFSLACVAIVLALLSRGRQTKMLTHARMGIICAIVGLAFNMIVIAAAVVPVLTDPAEREKFVQTLESFEDMMDDMMEGDYSDYEYYY